MATSVHTKQSPEASSTHSTSGARMHNTAHNSIQHNQHLVPAHTHLGMSTLPASLTLISVPVTVSFFSSVATKYGTCVPLGPGTVRE